MDEPIKQVALIGAGPIGIEVAVALKKAGIDYIHFDKRQIGQTIYWFPPATRFFSSNDRIAIAGIPLQTVDQSKASREDYLAYLRSVVDAFDLDIRTYEAVLGIEGEDGDFRLKTVRAGSERRYRAQKIVLATGDMHVPNLLGIPGEDQIHVSHYFHDPHEYFRRKVLVVGGRNSAVEAALRCYHVGAEVAISYRRSAFEPSHVKYWLLPEMNGRIERGEITAHFSTVPVSIGSESVTLAHVNDLGNARDDVDPLEVPAETVLLMTGFHAKMDLFRRLGIELNGRDEIPTYDEQTMETNVPGIFVAGTATAGSQSSYRVFIENCHVHGDRIVAALTSQAPPPSPPPLRQPES